MAKLHHIGGMPNALYLDCLSGISGNMFLGALLDLGLSPDELKNELKKLPLNENWSLEIEKVTRAGIAATHLTFTVDEVDADDHHGHHGRHLSEILKMIQASGLDASIQKTASDIFTRLAEAEAKVHGTTIEKIHFHEVGAVDAILDIVGAAIGIHLMKIATLSCSQMKEGQGTIKCAHGTMPVPVPAVVELLKGVPLQQIDIESELITPTGAAIAATLSHSFGSLDQFEISRVGYGAGTRDHGAHPNVLRAYLGQEKNSTPLTSLPKESVFMMTTNVDHLNGEQVGFLIDRLLKAGALDVAAVPALMKKGRPAYQLQCICRVEDGDALSRLFFKESGSLGIRYQVIKRWALDRKMNSVTTPWGEVRIKSGLIDGEVIHFRPEYEDCLKIATEQNLPLHEVERAAVRCFAKD
ncbi:MAG: nickel pincer cofactor biosynthesis protein LarC [Verrucomicrobiota bacterium]